MDEYRVKITKQAKEQLHLIKNYISLELKAPKISNKLLKLLYEHMKNLSFMPYRTKCIEEQPWGEMGFRKIRVKNYYFKRMIVSSIYLSRCFFISKNVSPKTKCYKKKIKRKKTCLFCGRFIDKICKIIYIYI